MVKPSLKISPVKVSSLQNLLSFRDHFESALKSSLVDNFTAEARDSKVFVACEYSLFSGGKRFRPLLCYAAGRSLGLEKKAIDGLAIAVEYIHTYSLIHDDLPCMDNDETRRGQPTTHIQFDEATALLAGDTLLTESFATLAHHYGSQSNVLSELVALVSRRAGGSGMVLGQILDMTYSTDMGVENLEKVHFHKTGGLISLCVEGAGAIAECSTEKRENLRKFGYLLGLAFQIKDDLLDADQHEEQSFVSILGKDKTEIFLRKTIEQSRKCLIELAIPSDDLSSLLEYNFSRDH